MSNEKPELKVTLKFRRIGETPTRIAGFEVPDGDWYVTGSADRRRDGELVRAAGINAVLTEEHLQDLFLMLKRGNDRDGLGSGGPLDTYRFLFPREWSR